MGGLCSGCCEDSDEDTPFGGVWEHSMAGEKPPLYSDDMVQASRMGANREKKKKNRRDRRAAEAAHAALRRPPPK